MNSIIDFNITNFIPISHNRHDFFPIKPIFPLETAIIENIINHRHDRSNLKIISDFFMGCCISDNPSGKKATQYFYCVCLPVF